MVPPVVVTVAVWPLTALLHCLTRFRLCAIRLLLNVQVTALSIGMVKLFDVTVTTLLSLFFTQLSVVL